MIVRTRNSVYEIDLQGGRARRVDTDTGPGYPEHRLSDGEWHTFTETGIIEPGWGMVFVWADGRSTITSPVVSVEPREVVFAYSEWLDQQGLVVGEAQGHEDPRSHEELVSDFFAQQEG